jgi:hypothetical protein
MPTSYFGLRKQLAEEQYTYKLPSLFCSTTTCSTKMDNEMPFLEAEEGFQGERA